jgi:hypothetical protein
VQLEGPVWSKFQTLVEPRPPVGSDGVAPAAGLRAIVDPYTRKRILDPYCGAERIAKMHEMG